MTQQHDAPEGGVEWKMVPVEPDQNMVNAAYKGQPDAINVGFSRAYRDMLAAAPTPPAPSGLVDAVRPKILEAADIPSSHNLGDWALTCEWPDGRETLEHVSDQAARLLGFVAENEGDGRDDTTLSGQPSTPPVPATLSGQQGGAVPAGDLRQACAEAMVSEMAGRLSEAQRALQDAEETIEDLRARLAAQPAPAGTGADGAEGLREKVARIADDFYPDRAADASQALEEMREAFRAALDAGSSEEGR